MFKFLSEETTIPVTQTDIPNGDSNFRVPLTTIKAITNHDNADKLEIAHIYGFQVVVRKGEHKVGDEVIYIPIDSILTEQMEKLIFGPESKIKLDKRRVRQIRIRKLASQGMIIKPEEISSIVNPSFLKLEQDLSAILGVTKYTPPERGPAQTLGKPGGRKAQANPFFHQYNGLGNIKWFPDLFMEGEEVVIQEKLHGCNARAAKLPFVANTFWKKLKQYFGFASKYENLYGSNRVDISNTTSYKGYYGGDIYGAVFERDKVFDRIMPNETWYGEIIGPKIQNGYTYGLDEHRFVVFDIKILHDDGKQEWLAPEVVEKYCQQRGFEFVPVLYKGPFNKELAKLLTFGHSEYGDKSQPVREGIVIKARENYDTEGNKKAIKWISEIYLDDKNNTDFQ